MPTSQTPIKKPDRPASVDATLWSQLTSAPDAKSYVSAWFGLLDQKFREEGHGGESRGLAGGVVVMGPADQGPFQPIASWPEKGTVDVEVSIAAELAMTERKGAVRTWAPPQTQSAENANIEDNPPHNAIALPLIVDNHLHGVAAIELAGYSAGQVRGAMRQLQWACSWLELLIRRRNLISSDRLITVLDLAGTGLEHERFYAAATAVANEQAATLSCDWVSWGFKDDTAEGGARHTTVAALSNSADFAEKSSIIRAIGAAMDEAIDQRDLVVYPEKPNGPPLVTRAHEMLAEELGGGWFCTIPFGERGRMIGAMMLKRTTERPLSAHDIEVCRQVTELAGPALELKRREDRWIGTKIAESFRAQAQRLFGEGYTGRKLVLGMVTVAIAALSMVDGDYRVTAAATLEGEIQRAITVPMSGFIAEAVVRAGDQVKGGQVLATLDDRDLRLEQMQVSSQREQRRREYREAMSRDDRSKVGVLRAQLEQDAARLALVSEQLARAQIVAPFDGIVVSGDLSQSLGSPVERGDILFEVAPLDRYRVMLNVDEWEISQIRLEQSVQLVLSALPGQTLEATITKITPVARTEEGRNFFRVEGRLDSAAANFRPGMEGVGKVFVDRRKLVWIWTHKFVHWWKLWLWSWWP